jgi:hypothetical protein
MSYLQRKQIQAKAVEGVKSAFLTLANDNVLPAKAMFPLGEIKICEGIVYVFKLSMRLKPAPEAKRADPDPGIPSPTGEDPPTERGSDRP